MIIKKSYFYFALIVVLLVVVGFFFLKSGNGTNGNVVGSNDGEVQNIVLGIKNHNYYPNTITIKVNEPVRISLDSSVTGCYRSFTIRDFGVSKLLRTPSDYVEFVPNKKGTFRFACSMGMGYGTIIVE